MTSRIAEIEARLKAATPGPWDATTRRGSWDWVVFVPDTPLEVCQMFHDGTAENETGEANATLIANAPSDIAYLLQALADERERCAKVADGYAATCRRDARTARELGLSCSDSGGTLDHYADLYEGIAAAIRKGPPP